MRPLGSSSFLALLCLVSLLSNTLCFQLSTQLNNRVDNVLRKAFKHVTYPYWFLGWPKSQLYCNKNVWHAVNHKICLNFSQEAKVQQIAMHCVPEGQETPPHLLNGEREEFQRKSLPIIILETKAFGCTHEAIGTFISFLLFRRVGRKHCDKLHFKKSLVTPLN